MLLRLAALLVTVCAVFAQQRFYLPPPNKTAQTEPLKLAPGKEASIVLPPGFSELAPEAVVSLKDHRVLGLWISGAAREILLVMHRKRIKNESPLEAAQSIVEQIRKHRIQTVSTTSGPVTEEKGIASYRQTYKLRMRGDDLVIRSMTVATAEHTLFVLGIFTGQPASGELKSFIAKVDKSFDSLAMSP